MVSTRAFVCAFVAVNILTESFGRSIDNSKQLVALDMLNKIVQSSEHVIVKRSKRGGIINNGSNSCPIGYGKTPDGGCLPCGGQQLIGCPELKDDEDYDNLVPT